MYQYAFNFSDYGAGGALGLMLMVVLMVFSAFYLRCRGTTRAKEVAEPMSNLTVQPSRPAPARPPSGTHERGRGGRAVQ